MALDIPMNFKGQFAQTIDNFFEQIDIEEHDLRQLDGNTESFMADLQSLLKKHSSTFKNEQVKSTRGYASGYTSPPPVREQLAILQTLLPNIRLTANLELATQKLPEGAEGFGVFPLPEVVANTYGGAVEVLLNLLNKQRNGAFTNHRENQLGPTHLRQHADAVKFWAKIKNDQAGFNCLIVPIQLCIRYRGCSVNRSRYLINKRGECGLGAYHTAIAHLLNPNRLKQDADLYIDCSGDEFSSGGDGRFGSALCFNFYGDRLQLSAGVVGDADERYGSASAFPPAVT